MTWNPDQYHQFKEARTAPARDLQAMVPNRPYRSIVDLGCGTGEQTLDLARRFPQAQVTGVDSSPTMLEKTAAHQVNNLHFVQADLRDPGGPFDLMYSNAALQWVPDHAILLAQLWEKLSPGGVLAVQVPANQDHPSHRLLTETAAQFAAELGSNTALGTAHGSSPVLTPAEYAELLDELGAQQITAQSRVYPVVLDGADGIVEWTKGTALVPYLSRLNGSDGERFLAEYLRRLKAVYPGPRVYYAFTRVLFTATKP